ncbi:transcriptional regulator, LysR family [Rhodobacteraceae bacterium KLH11]|nr:transcriptional regulator, LysR family [Rhodobacteraceae bacterium KLH11]
MSRQIKQLEGLVGARMLDRDQSGCALTDVGKTVLEHCERIETQVIEIERKVSGKDNQLSGPVKISTAEGFGAYWLAPRLKFIQQAFPEIKLELSATASAVNLHKREADIVLRLGNPISGDLVGKRVTKLEVGLFAAESYLANARPLETLDDLRHHQIIESGGQAEGFPQSKLLRQHAGMDVAVAARFDNLFCQIGALQSGMGLLALPLYIAKNIPGIRHLLPKDFNDFIDLWILTHPDLREIPRINAVVDKLYDLVSAEKESLFTIGS